MREKQGADPSDDITASQDDLNYGKAALKIFILGVNKEEDR